MQYILHITCQWNAYLNQEFNQNTSHLLCQLPAGNLTIRGIHTDHRLTGPDEPIALCTYYPQLYLFSDLMTHINCIVTLTLDQRQKRDSQTFVKYHHQSSSQSLCYRRKREQFHKRKSTGKKHTYKTLIYIGFQAIRMLHMCI